MNMHAGSNKPQRKTLTPLHAATPVSFGACAGLYMSPNADALPANTAVLFVSPWGFEEVCLRKFHRQLADALAARGIASLRFDFPGTGNSIEDQAGRLGLESWLESISQATEALKHYSGCANIVLAGHSLGAMLAINALPRLGGISGLALLAPSLSGRLWVRETGIWWKLIAADLGISGGQPEDGSLTIAGLELPAPTAKEIKTLKLSAEMVPSDIDILIAVRPGRESDANFAAELKASGHHVTEIPFRGHEALIANPVVQKIPADTLCAIADNIRAMTVVETPKHKSKTLEPAILRGENFTETSLRFHQNNRLIGTLCEPVGARKGATVIIHGTSYERSTGWGRSAVETARKLAAEGIATFRFDAANVGDSPHLPGAPAQVLYSDLQIADTMAAIDFVEDRGLGPVVLSGRCSGSYAAFQTALADDRVKGLALMNNIIFVWDPAKKVDDEVSNVARPLEDYSARARDPETLKRLLKGQVDIPSAAINVGKAIGKRIAAKISPYVGSLSAANRHKNSIVKAFDTLAERNVPLHLVYADNDVGLEQFKLTFGLDAASSPPTPNIAMTLVANADHNMTPAHARAVMIEEIRKLALEF